MAEKSSSQSSNGLSILVAHGSDKHEIFIDDPSSSTIHDLKEQLHDQTGVPPEGQKLIFKGRSLQDGDQCLVDVGVKDKSKFMLLGRKVDPTQNDLLKNLEEINKKIDAIDKKISNIQHDLDNIENGFLLATLVTEAAAKMTKQCASLNELLLQLLEQLDTIVPSSSESLIRGKRKALVTRVQSLLSKTDQLNAVIMTAAKGSSR